jgi:ferredoxin-NADP reductase
VELKQEIGQYLIGNRRYRVYVMKLTQITQETPDTFTYRFALDGITYPYKPGQYATLLLDGSLIRSYFEEGFRKGIIPKPAYQRALENLGRELDKALKEQRPPEVPRRFSIASPPTRKGYIELTIERYVERDRQTGEPLYFGLLSNAFIDRATIGEYYHVTEADGDFIFEEGTCSYLNLIAGGSGIVPFMCYLRYIFDKGIRDVEVNLLYSSKTKAHIIYRNELEFLASKLPNLHITHALTREFDPSYAKIQGRIDNPQKILQWLPREILTHEKSSIRICGSAEFIQAMIRLLLSPEIGAKRTQIKIESYYAGK